jgi:hypothetical protein
MPEKQIIEAVFSQNPNDENITSKIIFAQILTILDNDVEKASFLGYYDIPIRIKNMEKE